MGRLHSLALGGGDGVLHGGAVHLGDGVAVLHLHRDELDLGVIHLKRGKMMMMKQCWRCWRDISTYTVLGGDLSAGVLHGGSDRVGHSVGGISQELSISIRLRLGLSLTVGSVGGGGWNGDMLEYFDLLHIINGLTVTDHIDHVLADLLVLDLLGLHDLGLADVLRPGGAGLGDEDLVGGHTVGGGHSQRPGEPELRVGLGVSRGGRQAGADEEREGEELQYESEGGEGGGLGQAPHLVHVVTRDTSHDTSRAEVMASGADQQPLYNNCYNESASESFPELSKMSRIQEELGLPVSAHLRFLQ